MMVPFESVLRSDEVRRKSVVEPMLLTEKRLELTPAPVEEPMTNRSGLIALLDACIANCPVGDVVPTPTLPELVMMKSVLEEDPTTNAGALPNVLLGLTERRPYGVVEPMPILPPAPSVRRSLPLPAPTVELYSKSRRSFPLM